MESTLNKPEQNTSQKPTLFKNATVFIINYGIVILPIFLFLLFMFLLIFFYYRTPSSQTKLITFTSQSQISPIPPTIDLNPQVNRGNAHGFQFIFQKKTLAARQLQKLSYPMVQFSIFQQPIHLADPKKL